MFKNTPTTYRTIRFTRIKNSQLFSQVFNTDQEKLF